MKTEPRRNADELMVEKKVHPESAGGTKEDMVTRQRKQCQQISMADITVCHMDRRLHTSGRVQAHGHQDMAALKSLQDMVAIKCIRGMEGSNRRLTQFCVVMC